MLIANTRQVTKVTKSIDKLQKIAKEEGTDNVTVGVDVDVAVANINGDPNNNYRISHLTMTLVS